MADKPVSEMTRPELNEHATSLGIEGAEGMKNADEVRAAIAAKEAEGGDKGDSNVVTTNGAVGSLPPAEVQPAEEDAEVERLDIIREGGLFIVDGRKVDANGREVK